MLGALKLELDAQSDLLADQDTPLILNQQTAKLLVFIAKANLDFSL